jgi:hypothetical protein
MAYQSKWRDHGIEIVAAWQLAKAKMAAAGGVAIEIGEAASRRALAAAAGISLWRSRRRHNAKKIGEKHEALSKCRKLAAANGRGKPAAENERNGEKKWRRSRRHHAAM